MSFFCDLRVLAKKFASRLATQRKSLRKFNLRPLATTYRRSVWPWLNLRAPLTNADSDLKIELIRKFDSVRNYNTEIVKLTAVDYLFLYCST